MLDYTTVKNLLLDNGKSLICLVYSAIDKKLKILLVIFRKYTFYMNIASHCRANLCMQILSSCLCS